MLVPKKNRLAIYSALFKEGVMTAKKDVINKHHELEVPNLHVIKLMQSLHSRAYVTYKFNWQWFYYSLTNEGIEYLREYLHLSADTVPNTLKKSGKVQPPPSFGSGRVEGAEGPIQGRRIGDQQRRRFDDREGGYRGEKSTGAPGDFNPEYAGETRGDGQGGGFRGRGGRGRGFRGGRGRGGRGRGGRGGFGGDAPAGDAAPAAAPQPAASS
jgi:small subunit ribosomal protein S10e